MDLPNGEEVRPGGGIAIVYLVLGHVIVEEQNALSVMLDRQLGVLVFQDQAGFIMGISFVAVLKGKCADAFGQGEFVVRLLNLVYFWFATVLIYVLCISFHL